MDSRIATDISGSIRYLRLDPVSPGIYSLILDFPGRIASFLSSAGVLDPVHIEIGRAPTDEWRITVSLLTREVSVSVAGVAANHGELAALLCPDPALS